MTKPRQQLTKPRQQLTKPWQQQRAINPIVSHMATVARAMHTVGIDIPPKASVQDLDKKL